MVDVQERGFSECLLSVVVVSGANSQKKKISTALSYPCTLE